jgi:uncharacterized protein
VGRIVIPGGTGYLGQHLARRFRDRGDEVVVLTRGRPGVRDGIRHVTWDGCTLGPWTRELDGAAAVVHLAGKRVDARPTRRNVDALVRSRVEPVRVVGEAIAGSGRPPPVWVQLATLAIFGEGGDQPLDEAAIPSGVGPRQMVTVALAWEHAFRVAAARCERSVLLRSGIAIGPDDPATGQLVRLARYGLGGRIGSGRQWVSWIALDDLVATVERAVDDQRMAGTYHLTSPEPVRNHELMAAVRHAVGRRVGLPSPAAVTRLGAWVLGSDPALALTGRRGVPARLQAEGVVFTRPRIEQALAAALAPRPALASRAAELDRPGARPSPGRER